MELTIHALVPRFDLTSRKMLIVNHPFLCMVSRTSYLRPPLPSHIVYLILTYATDTSVTLLSNAGYTPDFPRFYIKRMNRVMKRMALLIEFTALTFDLAKTVSVNAHFNAISSCVHF